MTPKLGIETWVPYSQVEGATQYPVSQCPSPHKRCNHCNQLYVVSEVIYLGWHDSKLYLSLTLFQELSFF